MADEGIAPEEYEGWLTPAQAVELLGAQINVHESIPALVRMLRDGLLESAARNVVVGESREPPRGAYVRVQPAAWTAAWLVNPRTSFWRTGAFETEIRDDIFSSSESHFSFHGVRFEPDAVKSLIVASASEIPKAADAAKGAAADPNLKPLAPAERQRFARLYHELFGADGTETAAVLAVRACYPDKFVSRDAFLADFRAIRGKQVPGRKRQTAN